MTTAPADEVSEPAVPQPPRRVPAGVVVAASFLGVLAALLVFATVVSLLLTTGDPEFTGDSVGTAAGQGLLTAALAVCAAAAAAVAWSLVRDGATIGAHVTGALVMLAGLISIAQGVLDESSSDGVRLGILALALGLGATLPILVGQSPLYLAARRVWAGAERDWLNELADSPAPFPPPVHQPWPTPQPTAAPAGQPWTPYQTAPEPPYPGQAYQAQPYPAQPYQGQPVQGQPVQGQPVQGQPVQGQPVQGQLGQGQASPWQQPPPAAAQQAPTEHILPASAPPLATAQQAPTESIPASPPTEQQH